MQNVQVRRVEVCSLPLLQLSFACQEGRSLGSRSIISCQVFLFGSPFKLLHCGVAESSWLFQLCGALKSQATGKEWLFFPQHLLFYLFIFKIYLYLFLAVLGLRFCARALCSCSERGPLFIAVRGPVTIAASLVAEHRLQTRRLGSCGSRAQLLRGMWDLPRPGLEPVSPASAGRFPTTAPPGKPTSFYF